MVLNLADHFYLKALENYPYELEMVLENLQYAIGHDEVHAASNCLMGRIYMYRLKNYPKAGRCFFDALKGDINYPDTYKYYSLLRIWEGEYERAMHIIERGLKIKGMDQIVLLTYKSNIYERQGKFFKAKHVLKQAQMISLEKSKTEEIEKDLKRIKKKIKIHKERVKAL